LNNLSGPVGCVDRDDLALREWVRVDFMAAMILSAMSRVIEQRDDLFIAFMLNEPSMMLETELDVGAKVKVGPETTQTPDDLTSGTIDFVYCTSITSRDQVVALGILVNRVDMEVVPCVRRIVSGTCLARIQRKDSLCLSLAPNHPYRKEEGIPLGETCSRLDHSKSSSPVSISSSYGVSLQLDYRGNNYVPWKMASTIHCCSGLPPQRLRSVGTG
jgi:hypothetical protein